MTASNIKPDCFGGVVIDGQGRVLLRTPASGWGGFAWTFAKGSPDAGESPEETALREVLEETGYACEIIRPIPGTFVSATSCTIYFLMRPVRQAQAFDRETDEVRWVILAEAREMLGQSSTPKGRARDLAALDAAVSVIQTTR